MSSRVKLPAVLAIVVIIVIGCFFYWQLTQSIGAIEGAFQALRNPGPRSLRSMNAAPDVALAAESQALLLLRQGELLELKGEWSEAQKKFAESVEAGGGVSALRRLAQIQMQRRDFGGAAPSVAALSRQTGDTAEIVLLQGLLELRSGRLNEAKRVFSRKSETPDSAYGLALVAIAEGDHEDAKILLARAGEASDPTLRSAANALLGAYSEFALFVDGRDEHLATLLSRALAQVSECETALPLLKRVTTLSDEYRDAWVVKGYCEFTSERWSEALASLERAYAIDPEKPEIQYFLARTYHAIGDPKNAVTFLKYAVLNGFTPEVEARELLADYALAFGDSALALEQYQKLTDLPSGRVSAFDEYITLAVETSTRLSDANLAAKRALKKWPDDPTVLSLAALAAHANGHQQDAEQYLRSALAIDPKNAKALELTQKMAEGKTSSAAQ